MTDSKKLKIWATGGEKIEPSASKIANGWQLGEQPAFEWFNWLQSTFGEKLNYILQNGISVWNSETAYLADDVVKYNNRIWIAKQPSTNQAPTIGSVNWDYVIMSSDLDGVLDLAGLPVITPQSSDIIPFQKSGVKYKTTYGVVPEFNTIGMQSILGNAIGSSAIPIGIGIPENRLLGHVSATVGNIDLGDGLLWDGGTIKKPRYLATSSNAAASVMIVDISSWTGISQLIISGRINTTGVEFGDIYMRVYFDDVEETANAYNNTMYKGGGVAYGTESAFRVSYWIGPDTQGDGRYGGFSSRFIISPTARKMYGAGASMSRTNEYNGFTKWALTTAKTGTINKLKIWRKNYSTIGAHAIRVEGF